MYRLLAWTYDKVGNRLTETRTPSGGTTTTKTYTYPSTSNRLASSAQGGTTMRSFTYDAMGNNTVDPRSGVEPYPDMAVPHPTLSRTGEGSRASSFMA